MTPGRVGGLGVRGGSVGGSGAEGAASAILGEGPVAESIWWKHRDIPVPTGEPPHEQVDVAVVGAGVTGLTAALLLARAGRSVVVLEARHPGAVTTGRTTGKVSALQGTMLSRILRAGRRESIVQRRRGVGNRLRTIPDAAGDVRPCRAPNHQDDASTSLGAFLFTCK